MDSTRRRLAILCGQPDEEFQKLFIEGFEEQAFKCGYDVCVFAMYLKFQDSKPDELGDSNIFNLINGNAFDGIVVLADTIQTPGVKEAFDERISSTSNCPVIYVDSESKTYPSVNLPHYGAIVKIIEHLITEHGYKDIAFITGKEWHPHARERLKAFVDTMEKYNLPIGEDRIIYGDFWYPSGVNIAESFIKEGKPLPEAFACANDYMAIGLASALIRNGIRVPEDVAVIGYDSVEEGRTSPVPITSVYLPVKQYGSYAASTVINAGNGGKIEEFVPEHEFFRGASCGCHCESMVPKIMLRSSWRTDLYARPFFSLDNRFLEGLYIKDKLSDILDVIMSYTHHLGNCRGLGICLNSEWIEGGFTREHTTYSDRIYEVIDYKNGDKKNAISFDRSFPVEDILPDLYEEHDEPRLYLFVPLHFENRCFGYGVMDYTGIINELDITYLFWFKYIRLSLDVHRRRTIFFNTRSTVEEIKFTDNLTGHYNYDGLVNRTYSYIRDDNGVNITFIAIDISGLGAINSKLGRREGDKVIIEFSRLLTDSSGDDNFYGRLGNDEFIIAARWHDDTADSVDSIISRLRNSLGKYNEGRSNPIDFTYGYSSGKALCTDDIEALINAAVSNKNGNKTKDRKLLISTKFTGEEKKLASRIEDILDNNRFDYHFQPIIETSRGNIFAYEALMRPISDPYIAPPVIIEYAERMGRIEEVERYTFMNVLDIIESHPDVFAGKKVFINSLPGIRVTEEFRSSVIDRIKALSDMVVIELTEHHELDDITLSNMKDEYDAAGVQVAIDDYGTGYSNIVNLLRYMPDYVKIDRMLTAGIEDNPQKQHFVSEIVQFAHENRFKILSEGVETSAEMETCIKLGADLIQGYYTARPEKEIIPELPQSKREEIYRYYEKYYGDVMGVNI